MATTSGLFCLFFYIYHIRIKSQPLLYKIVKCTLNIGVRMNLNDYMYFRYNEIRNMYQR